MSKAWYKSKTIWVSIFGSVGGLVGSVASEEVSGANGIIIAVCMAVMAVLRAVSGTSLTVK